MTTRWRLRSAHGDVVIVRWGAPGDARTRIPDPVLRGWWDDPASRPLLLEMLAQLVDGATLLPLVRNDHRGAPRLVVERLARALRDGELRVQSVVQVLAEHAPTAPDEEPEPPPDNSPHDDTTWIEIVMVDGDGAPVGFKAYRLELPDGSVRTGTLNSSGAARVEGIKPGTCKVSFPEIDGREWSAG